MLIYITVANSTNFKNDQEDVEGQIISYLEILRNYCETLHDQATSSVLECSTVPKDVLQALNEIITLSTDDSHQR